MWMVFDLVGVGVVLFIFCCDVGDVFCAVVCGVFFIKDGVCVVYCV